MKLRGAFLVLGLQSTGVAPAHAAPAHFEALHARAEELEKNGQSALASAAFLELAETIAKNWPTHPAVARALLSAADLSTDVEEKQRLLERIVALPHEPPEASKAMRARLLLERRSAGPKAELLLAHATYRSKATGPAASEALFRAAQILASDFSDLDEAMKPLARLVEDPKAERFFDARMLRAEISARLGNTRAALDDYRAVATSSAAPTAVSDDARVLEADCLTRLERQPEAIERYLALVEARPESPLADRALFEAAKLLEALGRRDEAKAQRKRLAELRPASPFLTK